jgi:hypothetical protein
MSMRNAAPTDGYASRNALPPMRDDRSRDMRPMRRGASPPPSFDMDGPPPKRMRGGGASMPPGSRGGRPRSPRGAGPMPRRY